jgi:WD40-like Beta Propeller Repeat.
MVKKICGSLCWLLVLVLIAASANAMEVGSEAFDAALEAGTLSLVPQTLVMVNDPAKTKAGLIALLPENVREVVNQTEIAIGGSSPLGLEPISFSPNGEKMLAWLDTMLVVADFKESRLLFPWKPATDINEEMQQLGVELLTKPELLNISWSPDGNWLAFSMPKRVLQEGYYGANIWLASLPMERCSPLSRNCR